MSRLVSIYLANTTAAWSGILMRLQVSWIGNRIFLQEHLKLGFMYLFGTQRGTGQYSSYTLTVIKHEIQWTTS